MDNNFSCLVVSDFNIENFSRLLQKDEVTPKVDTTLAPFGVVNQIFLDPAYASNPDELDFACIWTLPELTIPAFQSVLNYEFPSMDEILAAVDQYAAQLVKFSENYKALFIPTWVVPYPMRGTGLLEMKHGVGVKNVLAHMNLRLSEKVSEAGNIYVLDTDNWVAAAGEKAYSAKKWYMGKIPFGNEVFKSAIFDVKAAIRSLHGGAKKLIVCDLDDTMWGGIVGDAGWENLKLGGHDAIGESFVDFQKALKALTNRGIILGIVSKNEESTALEAINSHPEMILKQDDFAGWRINWNDKARNIAELVEELNLGLQSVVFLDDNPVERSRVAQALPEVLVPDWPKDKTQYKTALLALDCFENPSISNEDARRTEMYVSERKRKDSQNTAESLDDWLMSLGVTVQVEDLNEGNIKRTVQLLNKTNQLNLTTRRMTEKEFTSWADNESRQVWAARVSDNYGDSGLTGILSMEMDGDKAVIADYVMSCRVMGKKVEETLLYMATTFAKEKGASVLEARYLETKKNKPTFKLFERSGFDYDEGTQIFSWSLSKEYPKPPSIELHVQGEVVKG